MRRPNDTKDPNYKEKQRAARAQRGVYVYRSGMGKKAQAAIRRTNPLAVFDVNRPAQRFTTDEGKVAYRRWPRGPIGFGGYSRAEARK